MTNYNDGKIHGWNGGECPVHPKSVVRVWPRESCPSSEYNAGELKWICRDEWDDIIAFQVVEPYAEPTKPREVWVNFYEGFINGSAYSTREDAERCACEPAHKAVHMREVIEG